jgi:hypothetical protein
VPIDAIYSGPPSAIWPVAALWPFSRTGWAWPLVPWGDVGATTIFITEMFALYRWPRFAQMVALTTLGALCAYLGLRTTLAA